MSYKTTCYRKGFTTAESTAQQILARVKPTKRIAFTLAEVLITLGIIGVVAALTIPGLINNYKAARLHSQFLKSYSTVQQAFKQMEADDVSLNPADYGVRSFYKIFMQYLTGATDCGDDNWSSPKGSNIIPCYNRVMDENSKDYKSYDGKGKFAKDLLDDGQIAMQDGTLIMFENSTNTVYVSVDLNGFNNPPNRAGYDMFTFQIVDGELVTMGDKKSDYTDMARYCNPKASNALNGITCAQKAKENSDYFKELIKEFK